MATNEQQTSPQVKWSTKSVTEPTDNAVMLEFKLPDGVTRDRHCSPNVNLDNCYALYFAFEYSDGSTANIIAWRDPKPNIRPLDERKRLRDLRSGDRVFVFGQPAKLTGVEIYR